MPAGKRYYGTQFSGGKFTTRFSSSLTRPSDIDPMIGHVTGFHYLQSMLKECGRTHQGQQSQIVVALLGCSFPELDEMALLSHSVGSSVLDSLKESASPVLEKNNNQS
jgi:hypothetical protein